jgi:hypothetical protein
MGSASEANRKKKEPHPALAEDGREEIRRLMPGSG